MKIKQGVRKNILIFFILFLFFCFVHHPGYKRRKTEIYEVHDQHASLWKKLQRGREQWIKWKVKKVEHKLIVLLPMVPIRSVQSRTVKICAVKICNCKKCLQPVPRIFCVSQIYLYFFQSSVNLYQWELAFPCRTQLRI